MKSIISISLLSLALFALSSQAYAGNDDLCDAGHHSLHVESPYSITFEHGDVVTKDDDIEVMRVSADGELYIKGIKHAVDSTQAALLKTYSAEMHTLVDDAKDIGKKGANLGLKIVGETIAALFTGDSTDDIKDQAHEQADAFKDSARVLCTDAANLRSTQQKLRQAIPEMGPYLPLTQTVI